MTAGSHNISQISQQLFVWLARWCQNQGEQAPIEVSGWQQREWDIAKAVIIVHGMGPTLGYLLGQQQQPHPDLTPQLQQFLRDQFEQNSQRIDKITITTAQVLSALTEHNIDHLCFKGLTIAQRLYPHRGMRPMADVDIYTGQVNQQKLQQALAPLDFQPHVINHEGMTLYPKKWSHNDDVSWTGAGVEVNTSTGQGGQSIWLQGESVDLPFSVDVHFTLQQGIEEFRYDIDYMFQQALRSGQGLTEEQRYIHLLLHASKHLRCRAARWVQLYDLYLLAQQKSIDLQAVLDEAVKHQFCHLLLWPLQLTRQIFNTPPCWLERQLLKHTDWRYQWLFKRHQLASLSHCNPQAAGLLYSLLWTQNMGKIRLWLRLSSASGAIDHSHHSDQLRRSPALGTRLLQRLKGYFNPKARTQWQIFSVAGLSPARDWE